MLKSVFDAYQRYNSTKNGSKYHFPTLESLFSGSDTFESPWDRFGPHRVQSVKGLILKYSGNVVEPEVPIVGEESSEHGHKSRVRREDDPTEGYAINVHTC